MPRLKESSWEPSVLNSARRAITEGLKSILLCALGHRKHWERHAQQSAAPPACCARAARWCLPTLFGHHRHPVSFSSSWAAPMTFTGRRRHQRPSLREPTSVWSRSFRRPVRPGGSTSKPFVKVGSHWPTRCHRSKRRPCVQKPRPGFRRTSSMVNTAWDSPPVLLASMRALRRLSHLSQRLLSSRRAIPPGVTQLRGLPRSTNCQDRKLLGRCHRKERTEIRE